MNLCCVLQQGLLKKHEAFETDFTVHRDRVNDVCSNGEELIKKVPETFLILTPPRGSDPGPIWPLERRGSPQDSVENI